MQTQRRVTEEEALRNARELIEEEELEKKREEKKKAKRKVLFLVARFVAKEASYFKYYTDLSLFRSSLKFQPVRFLTEMYSDLIFYKKSKLKT